jgi:hypothetical protein
MAETPATYRQRRIEGTAFLVAFCACVPLANWLIGNVGTVCVPQGPCLIPVAPGLFGEPIMAPSGVLMIGIALVMRDMVQRRLGKLWTLFAIAVGAGLSALVSPGALVVASTAAFLFSELADFAVYTPLQRRRLVLAVFLSGLVGLTIDSIVFLQLAFASLDHFWGQVLGKLWMTLLALPCVMLLRKRDRKIGLAPA